MAEKGELKSEVIKDVLGRRVVLTTERGKRPHDAKAPQRAEKSVPPEKCFFCPGNEHMTPPEIDRIEKGGKWEIRCFPNKFPAFMQTSKKAYGRHEIIVETPDHKKTLSELSNENIADYFIMVQRRMESAKKDHLLKYSCMFKNEGAVAGASLEHTHSQFAAFSFVPAFVKKIEKKEKAFSRLEKSHKSTIYAQNEGFFAFCPKASRFHFETWIVPKEGTSSILDLKQDRLVLLASVLKQAVGAIDSATGFGPYNIIFHSAPHEGKTFPFHLQILPRISTWAGFELATDIVMVSAVPRHSAKLLGSLCKQGD